MLNTATLHRSFTNQKRLHSRNNNATTRPSGRHRGRRRSPFHKSPACTRALSIGTACHNFAVPTISLLCRAPLRRRAQIPRQVPLHAFIDIIAAAIARGLIQSRITVDLRNGHMCMFAARTSVGTLAAAAVATAAAATSSARTRSY